MWIYNTDNEKWERQTDTLSKDNYDNLKVDLEKVKLYSKTLSGSTYLSTSNLDNIYKNLSYKDLKSWYIEPGASIYNSVTSIPTNSDPINGDTIDKFKNYQSEYGFTLKNLFTPEKSIEEINYIPVAVATTEQIDVNSVLFEIDGIKLIEGNLILVKNQVTNVDLAFTVDPNEYFIGNYYVLTQNVSDTTYYYYNEYNGIYKYTNNKLVKQTYATYSIVKDLTILVEQGTQADKQYALNRKLDGYYPVEGEPFEFIESHNYLVRHRVDYHNLFENNYYDIIKHATQSIIVDNKLYTIPSRTIYVGDFGVILNLQENSKSDYVYNNYKYNLRSITEVSQWYWMCGDNGTLLKMSKIDFNITKIDLGTEFKTLTSIAFITELIGIVVGKYNTIYYTTDGGFNWSKLTFEGIENYSYNKVVFYSQTKAYIGGESGVFLELDYSDFYGWTLTKRTVSKYLTLLDEYELIEDINDMYYTSFTSSWYDSTLKECLFLATNNGNIIIYDINNFNSNFDFLYLGFSQSLTDIKTITRQSNTSNILIGTNDGLLEFSINQFTSYATASNLTIGLSYSVIDTDYYNKIFDYNGQELLGVGNFALSKSYNYNSSIFSTISNADIKPKMLFMDYDLADKLNFFDSNYDYRLPNTVTFSTISSELKFDYISKGSLFSFDYSVLHLPYTEPSTLTATKPYVPSAIGDIIKIKMDNSSYSTHDGTYSIYNILSRIPSGVNNGITLVGIYKSYSLWATSSTPLPYSSGTIILNGTYSIKDITIDYNDKTYLDYLIDSYKTYGVNSNTALNNPIRLSSTFSYRTTSIATFSSSFISTTFNTELKNLYPNVGSVTASRYANFSPILPSSTNQVWVYRYIAIFKLPSDFCKNGDIISLTTDNVENVNMMVNYQVTSGSYIYAYAFHDMNGAMLSSLKSSSILNVVNLNKFSSFTELISNFEVHPFSNAYKISYSDNVITVEPRFNSHTAYKSLKGNFNVKYITGNKVSLSSDYTSTYDLFGFTPKYDILDYLSNINSSFTASKKFYSMPEYSGLPCNGGGDFLSNNIYYDANTGSDFLRNKLVFGNNLKFEWETLWVNTFVDITAYTSLSTYSKKLLIVDKYYDSKYGGWAIEFNDKVLDINDIFLNSIDIISRNTLEFISNDLDTFNNLNKPLMSKSYDNDSYYMSFYDNPIKTKIDTDSYTKILLSDKDIKKYITSIIYTDSENKLSMNVVNTSKINQIDINNSFNYLSKLGLSTDGVKETNDSFISFINFTGGASSSEYLNPSYIGIHTLNKIDDFNLQVNIDYLNNTYVNDIGYVLYKSFDPFFNYQPINLFDVGVDGMFKIPQKLNEDNFYQFGNTYSLINATSSAYVFRLIDGLEINKLSKEYHWILEAEISDAIIGLNNDKLAWYTGIWYSGRWFNGTWYNGTWISGDWYGGEWYSYNITDKVNQIILGTYNIDLLNSKWYNGRWYDGLWSAGTWFDGRWYSGTWSAGNWYNGIWNGGNWLTGQFSGGIWVQGTWQDGIFNSFNKPAFWIDGKFFMGDFQNGMWYNGDFGLNSNSISKFGSLSSNSRNSTWQGGRWISGNFYSYENKDTSGKTVASTIQKYSIWKTGIWNQGNFYGGIAYNTEFSNGHWYTGITKDIQIIGIDVTKNEIVLNGIFRFNIDDYINIINNGNTTPFSSIGSDSKPGRYRIALVRYDLTNNWTTLTLDYNFNLLAFDAPYRKPGGFYVGVTNVDPFGAITAYSTAAGQNGKNYIVGDTFSVVGGTTTAIGSIIAVDVNGSVISFNITTPGTGYSFGVYSTITSGSMSVISNVDTKLKAVSLFKNVTWDNGVFENGIVEKGVFYGCIWYNGIFNGTWGI